MCEAETSGARADLLHNAALCYEADFQHPPVVRSSDAARAFIAPPWGGWEGTKWRSQPRTVRLRPEPSLLCAGGWGWDAKKLCCVAAQRRTAVQRGLDRFSLMGGKAPAAPGGDTWSPTTAATPLCSADQCVGASLPAVPASWTSKPGDAACLHSPGLTAFRVGGRGSVADAGGGSCASATGGQTPA